VRGKARTMGNLPDIVLGFTEERQRAGGSKTKNYLITYLIIAAIRIKIINYPEILIICLYCLR
jgi:hypothetical protein